VALRTPPSFFSGGRSPSATRDMRVLYVSGDSPVASHPKSLFGLRRQPGRFALAVLRGPLKAYRHGWGWLFGHTFLVLSHAGRKTGRRYATAAMVLRYDPQIHEAVICSAWGQDTDWIRNIRARPALEVQIGRESFVPEQRFLSDDESLVVVAQCLRHHPWRFRFLAWILGWGDLRVDAPAREFVSTRPFVSVRPVPPG
jgi:deazaflavin-dependent oxidoreductase (nitroreductase family)